MLTVRWGPEGWEGAGVAAWIWERQASLSVLPAGAGPWTGLPRRSFTGGLYHGGPEGPSLRLPWLLPLHYFSGERRYFFSNA